MSVNDGPKFQLLDIDQETVTDNLVFTEGGNLYLELNEAGTGEVLIPNNSPAAAHVQPLKLVRVSYRGAVRGAFIIEGIEENIVPRNEAEGLVTRLRGRGVLAILAGAFVLGNDGSTRTFEGMTKGAILITLIDEAQARGEIENVTYDFSATEDSEAETWTDTESLGIPEGKNLLDVVRGFARYGIDFNMQLQADGTFLLQAFKNGMGEDKSDTIRFSVGVNCVEVRREQDGNELYNALTIKWAGGIVEVIDSASITQYGRRAKFVNAEAAQSAASATTYGAALLESYKDPQMSVYVKLYDGQGPRAFVDYGIGDYVMLVRNGVKESRRVRGIHPIWEGGNKKAHVVVTLNSTLYESELGRARDLSWLMDQWNTARDSNLLEARGWMAYNNTYSNISSVNAICQHGDYLYIGVASASSGFNGKLLRYNLLTGEWMTLLALIGPVQCITSIGTDIFFGTLNDTGPFGCFHRYDTLTGTFSQPLTILGIDSTWDASRIHAMVAVGTDLYVTGLFNQIGADFSMKSVLKIDTTDYSYDIMDGGFGFPTGNVGYALAELGGNVYLGYSGSVVGGVAADNVAMWDGSGWNALDTGLDDTVRALIVHGSNILAGGQFTDGISEWDGVSWTTFGGGTTGIVRALGIYLSDVYVGGTFGDIGNNVALYSGGVWNGLDNGVNNTVYTLLHHNQNLYVGGTMTVAGTDVGVQRTAIYYVTFQALADQLSRNFNSYDLGEGIHSATAVTTLSSNDEFPLWNAATQLLRKITWTNMWAAIKALIESVTLNLGGSSVNPFTGANTFNQGANGASPAHVMTSYGSSFAPFITMAKADGSQGSETEVLSGQVLGRWRMRGHDGSAWSNTQAEIRAVADDDWDGSSHPVRYEIYVTPIGSTTLTLAMTIKADGAIVLNTIKSGTDQAAAGAAAGEIWKTSGHATLPDDVLMIGV